MKFKILMNVFQLFTGIDLCKAIRNMKIYIVVDIILLLTFKNRIVKKNVA